MEMLERWCRIVQGKGQSSPARELNKIIETLKLICYRFNANRSGNQRYKWFSVTPGNGKPRMIPMLRWRFDSSRNPSGRVSIVVKKPQRELKFERARDWKKIVWLRVARIPGYGVSSPCISNARLKMAGRPSA